MSGLEMDSDMVVGPDHGFVMSGELYSASIGSISPDGLTGFVHQQEGLLLPPEVHDPLKAAEVLVGPKVERTVAVASHVGVMLLPEAPRTEPDMDLQGYMSEQNLRDKNDIIADAADRRVAHPAAYGSAARAELYARVAAGNTPDRRQRVIDSFAARHEMSAMIGVQPVVQPQEIK